MKVALFDLDGVILDTESLYTTFWAQIGERFFPETKDFALSVKGQTLNDIMTRWFDNSEEARKTITALLDEFELQMQYVYIPGAKDFLQKLKSEGVTSAIVTSSNNLKMDNVYRNLPELKGLVDRIFTAEDTPASKPAPDCYIIAARTMGYEPEECIVFEDSLNGLKAGRASGAKVVGLSTSLSADTIAPLCDIVIPHFENSESLKAVYSL